MHIDLNDPNDLTIDNVRCLIASGSDDTHTQLRVSKGGIVYLSKVIGNNEVDDLAFRLETWIAGNDYVGPAAAQDTKWIVRLYDCLKANWPTPSSSHIDFF
jgi:hypothetical protein